MSSRPALPAGLRLDALDGHFGKNDTGVFFDCGCDALEKPVLARQGTGGVR